MTIVPPRHERLSLRDLERWTVYEADYLDAQAAAMEKHPDFKKAAPASRARARGFTALTRLLAALQIEDRELVRHYIDDGIDP